MKKTNIAYKNLRAEMGRKNVSINDLSAILNINRDTLSRRLSRKTALALDEAFEIQARVFPECDVQYLFEEVCSDYIGEK